MKRVICVTGASDGLGKAISEHFSKTDIVVALARNEKKLKEMQDVFGVKYYVCDVTNSAEVERVMKDIISEFNRIDVLVNSAGTLIDGELSNCFFEDIKNTIDVNLTGLINTTKAASDYMKKQKQGTIFNINSQGGFGALAEKSVYNASKWGVTGFSRCLQPELAKYNVRVTDIMPGRMRTNLFSKIGLKRDMNNAVDPKDVIKIIEFVLEMPSDIVIPEIGIKHIKT